MFLLAWFYGILACFYGTLASLGLYQKEKEATVWLFGPDHIGKAYLLLMMQRPLTLERRLEWLKLRVERLELWLGPEERRVEQLLLNLGDEMQRLEQGLEPLRRMFSNEMQRLLMRKWRVKWVELRVKWLELRVWQPQQYPVPPPPPPPPPHELWLEWDVEQLLFILGDEMQRLEQGLEPLRRLFSIETLKPLMLEPWLEPWLDWLERILLAERPGLLGQRLELHQQSQLPTSAEFSVGKIKFKVSHFGGQQIARRVLTDYNAKVDAVVYFIGINELESRDELHAILSDNSLANVPFLILENNVHNWRDRDVCEEMRLNGLTTGKGKVDLAGTNIRPLEVFVRIIEHKMGYIEEGFTWLSQYIK